MRRRAAEAFFTLAGSSRRTSCCSTMSSRTANFCQPRCAALRCAVTNTRALSSVVQHNACGICVRHLKCTAGLAQFAAARVTWHADPAHLRPLAGGLLTRRLPPSWCPNSALPHRQTSWRRWIASEAVRRRATPSCSVSLAMARRALRRAAGMRCCPATSARCAWLCPGT